MLIGDSFASHTIVVHSHTNDQINEAEETM